jgi:hypothetical protein
MYYDVHLFMQSFCIIVQGQRFLLAVGDSAAEQGGLIAKSLFAEARSSRRREELKRSAEYVSRQ